MKIETNFWCKPIPHRDHDWSAIDASTYSGDETDPMGFGATEAEAISDLTAQLEERTSK